MTNLECYNRRRCLDYCKFQLKQVENNWEFIKCGSKNFESVASITSPAIDQPISNIVLTIDQITKAKINSIKLQVATDADCKNVTEEIPATIEDGDLIFKPTKSTANNYYKFVFDCQKDQVMV